MNDKAILVTFNNLLLSALLLFSSLVGGCIYLTSWDGLGQAWIGKPIKRVNDSWGEPSEIWTRKDGLRVYKYYLEELDPTCVHYWVVNGEMIIVDFYYEGRCHRIG